MKKEKHKITKALIFLIESFLIQGKAESVIPLLIKLKWNELRKTADYPPESSPPNEKTINKIIANIHTEWLKEAKTKDINKARSLKKLKSLFEKAYGLSDFKLCETIEGKILALNEEIKREYKNVGGRPYKKIDAGMVEALAAKFHTQKEIAQIFGVDEDTITRRKHDNKQGFADAFKKGKAKATISLRRSQFILATEERNPTMLVWLGKQELGQTDKHNIEQKVTHNKYDDLSDEELKVLVDERYKKIKQ